jgi:2-methylisocitrate lyase-like PEP mutase family enzyme
MPNDQAGKGTKFRALHASTFVMPNPWDVGSARMLEALGFAAIATSSYAAAGTLGRLDGGLTRDESLAMAAALVRATDIPVSADLENGFGDTPEAVQETVRRAVAIGLAGCSIEDAPADAVPYDLGLATERVAAAVEVARGLAFPFVLTARAENFVRGRADLDDTIKRLQAFERAGAEVLFAPGLPDLEAIRTVCAAVSKPVSVVGGTKGRAFTVAQLAAVGVRRISLATGFYRAAMTALRDAAVEVRDAGTFGFADRAMTSGELTPFTAGRR